MSEAINAWQCRMENLNVIGEREITTMYGHKFKVNIVSEPDWEIYFKRRYFNGLNPDNIHINMSVEFQLQVAEWDTELLKEYKWN